MATKATKATKGTAVPKGTAPAPAPAPVQGRATTFGLSQVVTVLRAQNPKAPNSKAFTRFAAYGGYNGHTTTVAAALAAGVQRVDLAWDVKHGHVTIA